jgi:hypothetical protein
LSSYVQPAIIGGVALGVLSALPVVNIANLCCCLWVICGGAVAVFVLQQRQGAVTPGEGAVVGLLAGVAGTFVYLLLAIPINLFMAPFQRQMMERLAELPNMPPWLRDLADRPPEPLPILLFLDFVIRLFVHSLFSTLGGVLGAMLFGRKAPPPAAERPRFDPEMFR